jgi:TetR/AcrR family transcriptional regulator
MIRLRTETTHSPLVEKLFKPMGEKTLAVVQEAISSREMIPVEPTQVTYSALGANVFYFLSAPMMRTILHADPFERGALEFRRKAAVEFLGLALFVDREHGARLAAKVLADTPMPEHIQPPTDPFVTAADKSRSRP